MSYKPNLNESQQALTDSLMRGRSSYCEIPEQDPNYEPLTPQELKIFQDKERQWTKGGRQGTIPDLSPKEVMHSNEKFRTWWLTNFPPPTDEEIRVAAAESIAKAIQDSGASSSEVVSINSNDIEDIVSETSSKGGYLIGVGGTAKKSGLSVSAYVNWGQEVVNRQTGHKLDLKVANIAGAVTSFSTSLNNVGYSSVKNTRGGMSKAKMQEYLDMPEEAPELSTEELEKRAYEELVRDVREKTGDITAYRKFVSQEIFNYETLEIDEAAEEHGLTGKDSNYITRKIWGSSDEDLDKFSRDTRIISSEYNSENYVFKELKQKREKYEKEGNKVQVVLIDNEIAQQSLQTALRQVKYIADNHDEVPDVVREWVNKFGEIEDTSPEERKRNRAIDAEVDGSSLMVYAIPLSEISNPDARPQSAQIFTNDKLTVKDTSLAGCVSRIMGDFEKEPDEIFYAEGLASGMTTAQIIKDNPRLEGKNVWVVSGFNAGNTLDVMKEMYHKHPNAGHYSAADNDFHVYAVKDLPENRKNKKNRWDTTPVLDDNGDYQIMGKPDREGDFELYTPDEVESWSLAEQRKKLKANTGLELAREFNEYAVEHPNFDSNGEVINPKVGIVVTNRKVGGKMTDSHHPASRIRGDGSLVRISPKMDINDLVVMLQENEAFRVLNAADMLGLDKDEKNKQYNQTLVDVHQRVGEEVLADMEKQKNLLQNYFVQTFDASKTAELKSYKHIKPYKPYDLSIDNIRSTLNTLTDEHFSPAQLDSQKLDSYKSLVIQLHEKNHADKLVVKRAVEAQVEQQGLQKTNTNKNYNNYNNQASNTQASSNSNNAGAGGANYSNGNQSNASSTEVKSEGSVASSGNSEPNPVTTELDKFKDFNEMLKKASLDAGEGFDPKVEVIPAKESKMEASVTQDMEASVTQDNKHEDKQPESTRPSMGR